jgi:hypothetical protein
LLDQPDSITPYTPKEETAKKSKMLRSTEENKESEENGIIDQPSKLNSNVRIGAKTKLKVPALVGTTVSFSKSFKPSASG